VSTKCWTASSSSRPAAAGTFFQRVGQPDERSLGSVEIVAWLATASDMLKLSQQSPVVGKKPLLLMLMLASGIDASRMGSDTHQIFAMAFGKTDY
jgi:hypothetical protein